MLYLQLFWEFFKTGLFAIGGGMATLPFLYDMADKTGWFTRAQLADMIAVSESTPGPIGVNMATYVGFLTGGVPGAVTATVGLIAPSVIVILIVAAFLQAFRDSKYVAGAFYGLALIFSSFFIPRSFNSAASFSPMPPLCEFSSINIMSSPISFSAPSGMGYTFFSAISRIPLTPLLCISDKIRVVSLPEVTMVLPALSPMSHMV